MAGAPLGNRNRATAAQVNQVLLEEARRDRWDLVRRAVRAQLQDAANGSLPATAWVFDRLAGKPMPMMPTETDRAFSITWSFGPQAIDIAGDSAEQAALPSAERSSEQQP